MSMLQRAWVGAFLVATRNGELGGPARWRGTKWYKMGKHGCVFVYMLTYFNGPMGVGLFPEASIGFRTGSPTHPHGKSDSQVSFRGLYCLH